jgi:hypothetical protein
MHLEEKVERLREELRLQNDILNVHNEVAICYSKQFLNVQSFLDIKDRQICLLTEAIEKLNSEQAEQKKRHHNLVATVQILKLKVDKLERG